MDKLSLQDPLFATYVVAATLMILKAVEHVVADRRSHDAGQGRLPFARGPQEDALNPEPDPQQLEPDERSIGSGGSTSTTWRTCRSSSLRAFSTF